MMKLIVKSNTILFCFLLITVDLFSQDSSQPPGANFDLSAWKLQTLKEEDGSFFEVNTTSELSTHSSNFFYTDTWDGAMVFRVPSNGGTTSSGTSYPRIEFRQIQDGGNWKLSDTNEHFLTAKCKVIEVAQVKPKTVIGQIHGSESNSELLKLRWTGYKPGECFVEARFQTNDNVGSEYGVTLATGLSLGDMIDYTITMKQGLVTVTVNGHSATQTYTTQFYGTNDKYYFKAGNYIQWNDDIVSAPPVIFGVNKFYKLTLHDDTLPTDITFSEKNNQFKIYPNPVNNFVTIESNLTGYGDVRIQIIDNNGIILKSKDLNIVRGDEKFRENIDLSELKSGVYHIRYIAGQKTEVRKLVISK
jgi:hypothetical protein